MTGGGQEKRLRAGTENVAAIAGFGAAAEAALADLGRAAEWASWRDRLAGIVNAEGRATIFSEGADAAAPDALFRAAEGAGGDAADRPRPGGGGGILRIGLFVRKSRAKSCT